MRGAPAKAIQEIAGHAAPQHHDATQQKYQQAIAELQKALIFNESHPLLLGVLAQAHALAGRREEASKVVAELKRIEAEAPDTHRSG